MKSLHLYLKRTYEPDRLCTIADGVYAIAITLLVLDLKAPEVPGTTDPELIADLLTQVPNFSAYIIGFIVIAYFWINHHRFFKAVTTCDDWALQLNMAHLLFISLTPYAASLIGHYEGDRIATIVFSADLGLAFLTLAMLGKYLMQNEQWQKRDGDGVWIKTSWWATYAGPGLALISIAVSFINIHVALLVWLLVPLRDWFLLRRVSPHPPQVSEL